MSFWFTIIWKLSLSKSRLHKFLTNKCINRSLLRGESRLRRKYNKKLMPNMTKSRSSPNPFSRQTRLLKWQIIILTTVRKMKFSKLSLKLMLYFSVLANRSISFLRAVSDFSWGEMISLKLLWMKWKISSWMHRFLECATRWTFIWQILRFLSRFSIKSELAIKVI